MEEVERGPVYCYRGQKCIAASLAKLNLEISKLNYSP